MKKYKRKLPILSIMKAGLLLWLVFGWMGIIQAASSRKANAIRQKEGAEITLASWNLENFSAKKLSDPQMAKTWQDYLQRINADILLVQEVNDVAALKLFLGDRYRLYFEDRSGLQLIGLALSPKIELIQSPTSFEPLGVNPYLRNGLEMTFRLKQYQIALLGVHLKSMCHEDPLSSKKQDCITLNQQVAPLQNWVSQHKNMPFIILGDFNRRFDKEMAQTNGDYLWPLLYDPQARGINAGLVRPGRFEASACHKGKFPYFIDHIVMNELAAQLVGLDSFEEVLMDNHDSASSQTRLSDHCALRIKLLSLK